MSKKNPTKKELEARNELAGKILNGELSADQVSAAIAATANPVVDEQVVEENPIVETPVEEAVSAEEDAPVEEAVSTEEDAPVEEVVSTEEDAPVEEVVSTEEDDSDKENDPVVASEPAVSRRKKRVVTFRRSGPDWITRILLIALLVAVVTVSAFILKNPNFGSDSNDPVVTTASVTTAPVTTAPVTTAPVTTAPSVSFNMDAFTASTANIAGQLTTDEDIAANTGVFVGKIGEDKLVELVEKYGELPVQKAIAEFLAFVPRIKMNQYINNNGLDYNPNAADDYYQMLDEADQAYIEATGKNPNGALMSLEGYEANKSNRDAMKALITETGDMNLLAWYEAKTTGYDAMSQQNRDTETAEAYKEDVKLELVNNANGSLKLLELQLEQKVAGTNNDTLDYTDVYKEFIINNYMYVVAN